VRVDIDVVSVMAAYGKLKGLFWDATGTRRRESLSGVQLL